MRAVAAKPLREWLRALNLRHGSVTVHLQNGEPKRVEVREVLSVEPEPKTRLPTNAPLN